MKQSQEIEVIWGSHREVTRDHLHVRAQSAPPMYYRVNVLGKDNQIHLQWVKAHVRIHGN